MYNIYINQLLESLVKANLLMSQGTLKGRGNQSDMTLNIKSLS